MDGALVGLVQNDDAVVAHALVQQAFSQQHPIGHVLDHCLWASAVLESDRVPYLLAQPATHLRGERGWLWSRCEIVGVIFVG